MPGCITCAFVTFSIQIDHINLRIQVVLQALLGYMDEVQKAPIGVRSCHARTSSQTSPPLSELEQPVYQRIPSSSNNCLVRSTDPARWHLFRGRKSDVEAQTRMPRQVMLAAERPHATHRLSPVVLGLASLPCREGPRLSLCKVKDVAEHRHAGHRTFPWRQAARSPETPGARLVIRETSRRCKKSMLILTRSARS